MGKTEIALDYAHRFHTRYKSVFWIDATNEDTAIDSMFLCLGTILFHCRTTQLTATPQCQDVMNMVGRSSQPSLSDEARFTVENSFLFWLSFKNAPRWLLILDNLTASGLTIWAGHGVYSTRWTSPTKAVSLSLRRILMQLGNLRLNWMHNCQSLTLLQFYDGTLPGAMLSAFAAARSAPKGIFSDSVTVEFPVTWSTMDKTAPSRMDVSRMHRGRVPGRDVDIFEEGCEIARQSAQICLWQDIMVWDSNVACEMEGTCKVRWLPSPWKWDDPGQDLDSGEVRPATAWPVISWSRRCP